jgi:hypothetical protein
MAFTHKDFDFISVGGFIRVRHELCASLIFVVGTLENPTFADGSEETTSG